VGTKIATDRIESQAELARLVEEARGGHHEAFAEVVSAIWPDLLAFARSVLGRTADAEDVAQEALLIAWAQLPTLRSSRSFYFWVRKIAFHLANLHLKATAPLVPIEEAASVAIHLVTSDIDIPRALAVLTPQQRAVIYLSEVEGMTCTEIGAALGVNGLTVRIYRSRAIARLRRHLRVELP